jgi:hypothetical protein
MGIPYRIEAPVLDRAEIVESSGRLRVDTSFHLPGVPFLGRLTGLVSGC